jgi:tetratricopeptide (TPR) repeat protein
MNFFKKLFGLGRRAATPAVPAAGTGTTSAADQGGGSHLIGPPESAAPLVTVKMGSALAVMDRMAYEYQAGLARGSNPSQAELDAALNAVDRLRVLGGGMFRDQAIGCDVLVDTRSKAEIEALRGSLRIVEDPATFGHCGCLGGPTIEFYAGKGPDPVATLALHHGHAVRWARWKHDAKLADPARLAEWLSRHDLETDAESEAKAAGGDPFSMGLLGLSDAGRRARRAESHWRRGEGRQALDECERSIALDPTDPHAYGVRGLIRREAGRFEEAEADCNEAVTRGLEHPEVYLARAVAREALGRPDEALADCDAALKLAPEHPGAFNSRALIRKRLGRSVEALADFGKALTLAPEWPLPAANRGMAHLEAGRFDRAVTDFTEAIRRVERLMLPDPAAWRGGPDVSLAAFFALRAEAHEAQGAVDSALADYSRAVDLDPEDPRVHLSRGRFHLRTGDLDEAIDDFSEAVRLRPDLPLGYFDRARARASGGDLDAALEDLDETVRWAPDDPGPHSFRSQILVSLGRLDDALRDLNRIVELAPENPMGYYQRAALWAARGDHARRFADLDAAYRLAPDWPEVCNALAWLLATCSDSTLRDGPRAAELARHALQSLPEPHAEYLDTLAAALAESGDFPQAISFSHQAIDLADDADRQLAYNEHLASFEDGRPWREPGLID